MKSTSNKDQYILAVECDGATYHSALWARERDRFRQEILEGFGWKFHRIWSTDWFYRREQEIARLRDAIDAADSCDQKLNFYGANSGQLTDEQVVIDEPIIQELKSLRLRCHLMKSIEIYGGVSAIEPHELSDVAAKNNTKYRLNRGPIHTKEVARRYAELLAKRVLVSGSLRK